LQDTLQETHHFSADFESARDFFAASLEAGQTSTHD
jgi:hypothetical protein